MKRFFIGALGFVLLISGNVFSHPGRTDASGGHHDRKNGGYHYHNGGSSSRSAPVRSYAPPVSSSAHPVVQTPAGWKSNPLKGARFQHGTVMTSGTQQVILIGQSYYAADRILDLRSVGDIGVIVGNPPIIHWYQCPNLAQQTAVTPISIGEFTKISPQSYCKTCLAYRTFADGTVELFKSKNLPLHSDY